MTKHSKSWLIALSLICFLSTSCSSIRKRNEAEQAEETVAVEKNPTEQKIDVLTQALAKAQSKIEELEARTSALSENLDGTRIAVENLTGPKVTKTEPVGELDDHTPTVEDKPAAPQKVSKKAVAKPVVAVEDLDKGAAAAEVAEAETAEKNSSSDEASLASYAQAINLMRNGNYSDAILSFNSFLATNSTHTLAGSAQFQIGECYLYMGEQKLAIPEYQKVFQKYPDSPRTPSALVRIAHVYQSLGEDAEAKKYITLAESHYPGNPSLDWRVPASSKKTKPAASAAIAVPVKAQQHKSDELPVSPMEMEPTHATH